MSERTVQDEQWRNGWNAAIAALHRALEKNAAPQVSPPGDASALAVTPPRPAVAAPSLDFLAPRIAWLQKEMLAGGDVEYLDARRKEAIYIADTLGVKWREA